MCYHCPTTASSDTKMMSHYHKWHPCAPFSVRVRHLDEKTGVLGFKSKHFKDNDKKTITLEYLQKFVVTGIDIQQGILTK